MSNPIAAAAALSEKQMRRVYTVINDKRNMAELARLARLDLKDVFLIVRKLAAIQRIQIYDPTGRRIDDLSIFDEQ
jgi:diadenosine tetraphosphate (Ap4A) HIT family hydrolase